MQEAMQSEWDKRSDVYRQKKFPSSKGHPGFSHTTDYGSQIRRIVNEVATVKRELVVLQTDEQGLRRKLLFSGLCTERKP